MNALHKDLERLIPRIEAGDRASNKNDPYRLQYHLMPPTGWMNDPNGLCWYKGEYHVFFQYGPFDAKGGVKCWGHWSSPDLLHWTQRPADMLPDQTWDIHGVYSGSALVEDDALYLYYTGNVKHPGKEYDYVYTGRGHNTALAVSKDGVHIDSKQLLIPNAKYPHNMSCHVRDPKVWKQDGKYYMVLGARTTDDIGEVLVYESENKLDWKHINTLRTPETFGFMWECPDLFCVDGQFVLAMSPQGVTRQGNHFQNVYSCGYMPIYGDFRGEYSFGAYRESDVGFDYYAPQSFEAPDGRRIVFGWMGMPDADYFNPTTENNWQHCMSVPREVHWNGEFLTTQPVRELEQLRTNQRTIRFDGMEKCAITNCSDICITNDSIHLNVMLGAAAALEYGDGLLTLTLNPESGCGRTQRTAEVDELRSLRILLDTSCMEIFLNDGEQVMTTRYYTEDVHTLFVGGTGTAEIYDMQPMQMNCLED